MFYLSLISIVRPALPRRKTTAIDSLSRESLRSRSVLLRYESGTVRRQFAIFYRLLSCLDPVTPCLTGARKLELRLSLVFALAIIR